MYGHLIDKNLLLSLAQALPNSDNVNNKPDAETAALVKVGSDMVMPIVYVYANTAITVAESATLKIKLIAYSDNTPASAVSPYTNGDLVHTITGASGGSTIAKGTLLA